MTFFYNLNKKLNSIESAPESKQLNERDEGKHNNATTGFKALASKAAKEYGSKAAGERVAGAVHAKMKKAHQLEGEYQAGPDKSQIPAVNRPGNKVTLQDLEKERTQSPTSPEGLAAANKRLSGQHPIKEKMNPAKAKSFAALAEPKDKITFADKIAGAKKEVDEMLGDVAAEAMKNALSGGQKKLDKNNNGKLDANDFAMLRKGAKKTTDESDQRTPRVGDVEHGHKHDIEHTATGRKVTRRADAQGISVGSETDDEGNAQEKRGRGRPKGTGGPRQERATSKSRKSDRTAHGQAGFEKGSNKKGSSNSISDAGKALQSFIVGNKPKKDPGKVSVKHKMKEGDFGPMEEDSGELKAAMALLKKAGYKVSKDGAEELDEKAVSKKQQKFMGMVHATQKGEKAPSKEVAKVAKTMKKGDAEDFASTKHKGLPEKAPKKKEKTEEAGGSGTPTASSGFSYGKGIYDSLNRDLENAITESMGQLNESMSVNMSDSTEGGKSLTITATDEDALKLATLLKSAGLGGGESSCGCGTPNCSCGETEVEIDEVSMNEPDYPTNTETSDNAMQYSGGLDGPKSTGQSTVPVLASQDDRQHSYAEAEEDAIKRMMEMAGIKEGKKPDFPDVDNDGDEKESIEQALKDKEEKKVDESILAATRNLWKKYQG